MTGYGSTSNKLAALMVSGLLLGLWVGQAAAQTVADDVVCAGCVQGSDIQNGTIGPGKLIPGSINATTIANGVIGPNKLIPGSINQTTIATDAIRSNKILDGAVQSVDIADEAVTEAKLDADLQQRITDLETTAAPAYPASLVTQSAQSATVSIANLAFGDGRTIIGTCSPGGTVDVEFDWSITQAGGTIQQINVGFVGGDTRCVASGVPANSGFSSLNLTCPTAPGAHQLGVRRTQCFGCPPDCGNTGNHDLPSDTTPGFGVSATGPSFVGVVTVR